MLKPFCPCRSRDQHYGCAPDATVMSSATKRCHVRTRQQVLDALQLEKGQAFPPAKRQELERYLLEIDALRIQLKGLHLDDLDFGSHYALQALAILSNDLHDAVGYSFR